MKKIITKHVDDFIFKQLDIFKESEAKSKINDTLNSLTEQQHKIFSQVGSFILILIPFVILVSVMISNSMLKSEISLKQEILTEVIEYIAPYETWTISGDCVSHLCLLY